MQAIDKNAAMLADATHLEPLMADFGANLTACGVHTIEFLDNTCRPTTHTEQYGSLPSPLPLRRRQVSATHQFTNETGAVVEWVFPDRHVFRANHEWRIESIMRDGPQTPVNLPSRGSFPPPVNDFPPPRTISVQAFSVKTLEQSFSEGNPRITVPPNTTMEAYIEAMYALVELPIDVIYRVAGRTRFRGRRGSTTVTINRFFGIGEIMRPYALPRVVIVNDDAVDVQCGGRYSGELFQRWNIVARDISAPLASSDDLEVTRDYFEVMS